MLGYLRIRSHLHRWCMNLVTGETREYDLDDLNVEFPLPDTALYGSKTRYSYHQYIPQDAYTVEFHALIKYDHQDGSRDLRGSLHQFELRHRERPTPTGSEVGECVAGQVFQAQDRPFGEIEGFMFGCVHSAIPLPVAGGARTSAVFSG